MIIIRNKNGNAWNNLSAVAEQFATKLGANATQ